jgi:hypothetical protein
MRKLIYLVILLALSLAGCGGKAGDWPEAPLSLATFSENGVTVNISLEREDSGQDLLSATFIPGRTGGYLYSMDTPRQGMKGPGRPTLLELVPGSGIEASGNLTASVLPVEDEEAEGLFKYPDGPVTLSLPILLPVGDGWYDEQVSITYMACSGVACLPPVEGKLVTLRIPGRESK